MTPEDYSRGASLLNRMQRYVALEKGTEPPFENAFWDNHQPGVYVSVLGGLPLFSSRAKARSTRPQALCVCVFTDSQIPLDRQSNLY